MRGAVRRYEETVVHVTTVPPEKEGGTWPKSQGSCRWLSGCRTDAYVRSAEVLAESLNAIPLPSVANARHGSLTGRIAG